MDYYSYDLEDFKREKPCWEFRPFPSLEEQNLFFAKDLIKRIKKNDEHGKKTVVVLPVGPIDYKYLVELSNSKGYSLENLVLFLMDEYSDSKGNHIHQDHPLSFRTYIEKHFYKRLMAENRMPEESIIFPNGKDPEETLDKIEEYGGIDITYGGFGITGHLAFNDPPDNKKKLTEENVRYSSVRTVRLSRETLVQNAIGGTGGNKDIIPKYAVTLGMRELLSAREIHLYLLRTWHSGIMRRALFGPVDPACPGSYVQLHDNVKVHMTPDVLRRPLINVTLNIGN